ncbi:MAG: PfkB family carbohydrate kinase [Acidimicrobiia bacterium]|nr:PfkB family carbohydrate kinase [Acidimicrobiia bacterium]
MRIACLGGAHLDTKAHLINAPRLATSNPATVSRSPGGVACNVARNLARLGAEVVLCSLVGDDVAAGSLRNVLNREGVDDSGLITHPHLPTAGYLAVLQPDGGLVIGIADMAIYDAVDGAWVDRAAGHAAGADLWVVDANLPERAIEMLVERAPVPVLADPVSVAKAVRFKSTLRMLAGVFPDRAEAAVLANGDAAAPAANAAAIAASGIGTVVVSLGADGAHLHRGDHGQTRPAAVSGPIVDVTGAGDALLAGYAYALAAGEADPLGWGLAAASLAVESDESVAPGITASAVRSRLPE